MYVPGNRPIPWTAVALSILIFLCSALAQKPPADLKPTPKMSDKEAYKIAVGQEQAGKLEIARTFLMHAVNKKKKPEYDIALARVNAALANTSAAAGEAALQKADFPACEKQLKIAKEFAVTDQVKQLESEYQRVTGELRQKYDGALKEGEAGDPEGAITKLKSLVPHVYILPKVNEDIVRMTGLLVDKLLLEGNLAIDEHRWEDASQRFQRVQEIDAGEPRARVGLAKTERGRKAFLLADDARAKLKETDYNKAFKSITLAAETYPEASEEFRPLRQQITAEWIKLLLEEAPPLLAGKTEFEKTRDGYLRLQQIIDLNPANREAQKLLSDAKDDIGFNFLQRAKQLESQEEGVEKLRYEQIGAASVLTLNAQALAPDKVTLGDVKDAAQLFNRKRACQLVLSVENLAQADPKFIQTVQDRARNIVDRLGLPDMRIRLKDDFEKDPKDDPLFQDYHPDGKSAAVQLTISITESISTRRGAEKAQEVESKYICGKESKPNPEFVSLRNELDKMRKALDDPKQKKKQGRVITPEGWTDVTYNQKLEELKRLNSDIQVDKTCSYTFRKTEYTQFSNLRLNVNVRDYVSRDVISTDEISFQDKRDATEISDVRSEDLNGNRNVPITLILPEEVMRDQQIAALASLDKKIPELLKPYTDRFLKDAEAALASNKPEEAVESFLCHWTFHRGKLPTAQSELIELVKARTGFDLNKKGAILLRTVNTTPSGQ